MVPLLYHTLPCRNRRPRPLALPVGLLARVGDAPDGVCAVVGDHQGPVAGDGDADGAAPDGVFTGDEAGQEVFLVAGKAGRIESAAEIIFLR